MGIWSTLFNSSDTIDRATEAVISTGDKLFYTEEEKAEDRIKQREYFPTLLKAYEPFKIAQRVIAVWFSLLFGIAFLIALFASTINVYIKYTSKDIDNLLIDITPLFKIIEAFGMDWIMIAIVSFYFAGGVVDSYKRKGN